MSAAARLLANSLWGLVSLPEAIRFRQACRNTAHTQRDLLLRLLQRQAGTELGRRYDFASIRSVADYQARVPLSTYDDYRAAIEQIGHGWPHVLTREPVLLLEPTSGSTAASKYIPYTAALKAEFQRGIAPWIVDLFRHDPRLLLGQAYWSVTPVTRQQTHTPGGIPIGFEEDSDYFGGLQRHLIQTALAVPSLVKLIGDMAAFRYVTLLFLLRSRSLTLVSIWNPTFLILLVESLAEAWPQLAHDIEHGTLSPPTPLLPELHAQLNRLNRSDRRRAREIRTICRREADPSTRHACLWPQLRLISCWTEAQAALHVPELARLFPQAWVQGKGLIATEGFVSFPLVAQPGAALAVRSHFFEFLPVEATSSPGQPASTPPRPLLAHQLAVGDCYEVIITTGGGLYRYQLHDLVEVVGYLGSCPLLRFAGKAAHISDWFGEKLNERHVRQALERLCAQHSIRPAFAMVACDELDGAHAYILFIETGNASDEDLGELGDALERALQENFHYRYCRDLGQLAALRVFRIDGGAVETYLAVCQSHGQRAGDIKPVALHRQGGWLAAWSGRIVSGSLHQKSPLKKER